MCLFKGDTAEHVTSCVFHRTFVFLFRSRQGPWVACSTSSVPIFLHLRTSSRTSLQRFLCIVVPKGGGAGGRSTQTQELYTVYILQNTKEFFDDKTPFFINNYRLLSSPLSLSCKISQYASFCSLDILPTRYH